MPINLTNHKLYLIRTLPPNMVSEHEAGYYEICLGVFEEVPAFISKQLKPFQKLVVHEINYLVMDRTMFSYKGEPIQILYLVQEDLYLSQLAKEKSNV